MCMAHQGLARLTGYLHFEHTQVRVSHKKSHQGIAQILPFGNNWEAYCSWPD